MVQQRTLTDPMEDATGAEVWARAQLTPDEVRGLPCTFRWELAARAWGLRRSTADRMRRNGTFRVEVIEVSPRMHVVRRSDLMASLGIEEVPEAVPAPAAALVG